MNKRTRTLRKGTDAASATPRDPASSVDGNDQPARPVNFSNRLELAAGADDRDPDRAAQPRRGAGDRLGYAVGALALGAFLIIGFAIQNTTEGLAIVAPLSKERPTIGRLAFLGVIAGLPAIAGTVIGAAAYNAELATLLIGVGVGAIVQVIQQLIPAMRDSSGRALHPGSIGGLIGGGAALYITGLLVSV